MYFLMGFCSWGKLFEESQGIQPPHVLLHSMVFRRFAQDDTGWKDKDLETSTGWFG